MPDLACPCLWSAKNHNQGGFSINQRLLKLEPLDPSSNYKEIWRRQMHKTPMQSQINDDSGSFAQVSSVKQSGSMKQRPAIIDVPLHMKTRPDQKIFFYRYHIIDPCPVDRPSLIRSIIQNLIQGKDPPFDDPSEQGKMKG